MSFSSLCNSLNCANNQQLEMGDLFVAKHTFPNKPIHTLPMKKELLNLNSHLTHAPAHTPTRTSTMESGH